MKKYKKPTSTDYTHFFVEDRKTLPDLADLDIARNRKSNLILNMESMGFREKRKVAREIVRLELHLACQEMKEGNFKGAVMNLASALNTRKLCRRFNPAISNDVLREAWEKRDPRVLCNREELNTCKSKSKEYHVKNTKGEKNEKISNDTKG